MIRTDAAKKNQQDLLSAQQFISLNPYSKFLLHLSIFFFLILKIINNFCWNFISVFGPYDPYYPDAFLSG